MGNIASFNLKGNNNASDFNTGSNNWVQRLGHNEDFYNNPLGYNSSPTPRTYKIASNDDNLNLRDKTVKRAAKNIFDDEGLVYHPYLDTECYKSVGYAKNIDSPARFYNVNWELNGQPATKDMIQDCYDNLENFTKKECPDKGQYTKGKKLNYNAEFYQQFCPLTISEDTAIDLYKNHVWDDMQYVERDMPQFYDLPENVQDEIINLIYNIGYTKFYKNSPYNEIIGIVNNKSLSNTDKTKYIMERLDRHGISNNRRKRILENMQISQ